MNQQMILFKKSKAVIERSFLERTMTMFPTYLGFAVQDTTDGKPLNEKNEPFLEVDKHDKTFTVDQIDELQKKMIDTPVMFVFGSMQKRGETYDGTTDVQPFEFKAEDGSVIMAVGIEGDFSKYIVTGSKHSEEYNFWVDFLHPLMIEKYEASANIGDFYTKMQSSVSKQTILNAMSHRGAVVMIPMVGEPIDYSKNELLGQYDWGQASQGKVITDSIAAAAQAQLEAEKNVKEESAPVVAEKKSGRFALEASGEKTPAPAPKIAVDNTKVPEPKTDTSKAALEAGYIEVSPPKGLDKDALAVWYRTFFDGNLPPKHNHRPSIKIDIALAPFATKTIRTKEDAKTLQAEVKAAVLGTAAPITPSTAPAPKPTVASGAAMPTTTGSAVKYMATLDNADIEKGQELVHDYSTRDASKYPTALQIQSIEAKWPAFSTLMKIDPKDMFLWRIEDIKKLGEASPQALAVAFLEMRALARASVKLDVAAPAKAPAAPAPAPTPTPAPDKPAEPQKVSNDPMAFLNRKPKKAA